MHENGEIYAPRIAITTSRRKSNLTNTFIKILARVLSGGIIRRGSSNLPEIAYNVIEEGFTAFIVVYTTRGNPSVLNFYKLNKDGFFELFGRIFLLGVHLNRNVRGIYETIRLIKEGSSEGANELYRFMHDFMIEWKVNTPRKTIDLIIRDLEVYRDKWLSEISDTKFNPAEIIFRLPENSVDIIRLKVHHVWRPTKKVDK